MRRLYGRRGELLVILSFVASGSRLLPARRPTAPLRMAFEIPQQPEFEMGGGGLYGTARDYLRFVRMMLNEGKSSAILAFSRPKGQPPHFSPDSEDLKSRTSVTVPGFRTARSVASRR